MKIFILRDLRPIKAGIVYLRDLCTFGLLKGLSHGISTSTMFCIYIFGDEKYYCSN